ncbi:MAG: peptidoglycan DD-metalloendopeptidase family protein [Patescibacteria group bacterium]|nr:peptidoglycan DD-metalloendopeptidase family protein [Patescibacteria group bacterium]
MKNLFSKFSTVNNSRHPISNGVKTRCFVLGLSLVFFWVSSFSFVSADTLSDKQYELKKIQEKIAEHEKVLSKVRQEKLTLNNQIQIIDAEIISAQLALESVEAEIGTISLEKHFINKDLVELEEQALRSRLELKQAIRANYMYSQASPIEILLGADSVADFMSQVEYLDIVQDKISENVSLLEEAKKELSIKKELLENKDKRLQEIKQQKIIEEQSLQIQINSKSRIVDELKLSETEYQARLEEAKKEQQKIDAEIAEIIRQISQGSTYTGEQKLFWPINSRRITATFHDQGYARRFGLEHNAIDVATPQGTPIRSPASGVVSKVRDGGMGLSYLVINHDNGLATVYLHISRFAVSTGARVGAGQVIAYSGGTPGTPGAGWLTTGPHLHFEVWLDGIARNPLAYLVG